MAEEKGHNNIKIVDRNAGISFDAVRENLVGNGEKKSEPIPFAPDGRPVAKMGIDPQSLKPLPKAPTKLMKWVAEDGGPGNIYEESEIVWKLSGKEIEKIKMTKSFSVIAYRPLSHFTDRFIIEKYYEVIPSNDAGENASEREQNEVEASNLMGMYKLWKKLTEEKVVAGGHFNASSNTRTPGMAFIRAVTIPQGNHFYWALEMGVFKEEKIFQHLHEGEPKVEVVVSDKVEYQASLL